MCVLYFICFKKNKNILLVDQSNKWICFRIKRNGTYYNYYSLSPYNIIFVVWNQVLIWKLGKVNHNFKRVEYIYTQWKGCGDDRIYENIIKNRDNV